MVDIDKPPPYPDNLPNSIPINTNYHPPPTNCKFVNEFCQRENFPVPNLKAVVTTDLFE